MSKIETEQVEGIGDLNNLTTTSKEVVGAINEVNRKHTDFGSRNFLVNSFNFTDVSPWGAYTVTSLSVENKYLKVVGGSSGMPRFRNTSISSMMIYEKERVYFTLSVVYKNSSGQVIDITGKSSDSITTINENGSQSIGSINKVSTIELDDGWIKDVFEIYALAETPTIKAGWFTVTIPQNSTFYFRSLKLEKGRVATDWTPSPEDQISDWNQTDSTKLDYIKNKPTVPTSNDFITTNTNQTGLTGNKTSTGIWDFRLKLDSYYSDALGNPRIYFSTANGSTTNGIVFRNVDTFQQFQFRNSVNGTIVTISDSGLIGSTGGFSKTGATNNDVLLGAGGHRPVSDFALSSSLGNYVFDVTNNTNRGRLYHRGNGNIELLNIPVIDTRSTANGLGSDGTPNYIPLGTNAALNNGLTPLFHYKKGDTRWVSSIIMKGWTSNYGAWMISGHANTNTTEKDKWFLSSSDPTTGEWGDPLEIIHDGNLDSKTSALGFIKSSSLGNYLPLAGGTMTGAINYSTSNMLRYNSVQKFGADSINTIIASSATTGSTGIFLNPRGYSDSTNGTLFAGNGTIYSAYHGNSSQWNHEQYGLGVSTGVISNDWDIIDKTGIYYNSITTAIGVPVTQNMMTVFHQQMSATQATQIAMRSGADNYWFRRKAAGVWQPWVEIIHEGNLDSKTSALGFIKSSAVNTQLGNYVTLASVQTISATKTFTVAPIVPNGTLAGHTVNLGQLNTILNDYATVNYVDQQIQQISLTPGPQGPKGDKGDTGAQGIQGINGTNGADGKTLLSGTSNPANSLGTIGDWYLNRTTWIMFEKTATSTWTNRGTIKGVDGVNGTNGTNGTNGSKWLSGTSNPSSANGVVGDWYINYTTWDVFEKTATSTWTNRGNIKGSSAGIGDGDIEYVGVGAITGGGVSKANQNGDTRYEFDLTTTIKNDISKGVDAASKIDTFFGGLSQFFRYHDASLSGSVNTQLAYKTLVNPVGNNTSVTINLHYVHGAELVLQGVTSGIVNYNIKWMDINHNIHNTLVLENAPKSFVFDVSVGCWRVVIG